MVSVCIRRERDTRRLRRSVRQQYKPECCQLKPGALGIVHKSRTLKGCGADPLPPQPLVEPSLQILRLPLEPRKINVCCCKQSSCGCLSYPWWLAGMLLLHLSTQSLLTSDSLCAGLFFSPFYPNLPTSAMQQYHSSFIQTESQTSGKLSAGIISWKPFLIGITPKQSKSGTVWKHPCLLTAQEWETWWCLLRPTTILMGDLGGSGCGCHRAALAAWWSAFLLPGFLGSWTNSCHQWSETVSYKLPVYHRWVFLLDLKSFPESLRRNFGIVPQSGSVVPTFS